MADTHLHYYRCPSQASSCRYYTITAAVKQERWLRCPVCRRFAEVTHSVPIETDEQRALAERGIVVHTAAQHAPWECRRCGEHQAPATRRYYPSGGAVPCCVGCKDALSPEDADKLEVLKRQVAAMQAEDAARLTRPIQPARPQTEQETR